MIIHRCSNCSHTEGEMIVYPNMYDDEPFSYCHAVKCSTCGNTGPFRATNESAMQGWEEENKEAQE